MQNLSLINLWQREFAGYNTEKLRRDLLAGLAVASLALPLSLAFGVASGTTATTALVTAILAGFIISALSGTPYQISGTTGAISAILLMLVPQYGIEGIWLAGLFSGLLLLLIGLFKLSGFVGFIPSALIAGFTTGISAILFIGQIGNFLGTESPSIEASFLVWLAGLFGENSSLIRLLSYFQFNYSVDWRSIVAGLIVILTVFFLPAKWNKYVSGSLLGIVVATIIAWLAGFEIKLIGEIPRAVLGESGLRFNAFTVAQITSLIGPIIAITLLAMIETIVCYTVAGRETTQRYQSNLDMIAQGIGNMIIPFFGGIPATAAPARSLLGIHSGGLTRVVSMVQATLLFIVVLIFAPMLSLIPLAAIAGLLMTTAWQMNQWAFVRAVFASQSKREIGVYLVTFLATLSLGLTYAILFGAVVSAVLFLNQAAALKIDSQKPDTAKLKKHGATAKSSTKGIQILSLQGPLFFAGSKELRETIAGLEQPTNSLILDMSNVSLIDLAGVNDLRLLSEDYKTEGKTLLLSGVKPEVMDQFKKAGLDGEIGKKNFLLSLDQALIEADKLTGKQKAENSSPEWNGSTALALYTPTTPVKEKAGRKRK